MRRLAAAAGVLAVLLGIPTTAAALGLRSADGLGIVSVKRLDQRLIALTVRSSALPGPANIRILLPTGYASHPHRRYPVLYLLHGTSGGAADWTQLGAAEQTTAGKPLIVVMPDIALNDDGGGWCANWPDGEYRWETFHIDQLIPWVDGNLRTLASRGKRAIAGLSQGGFCSMSYAAQYPDRFGVALAYSGAPDIAYDVDAHLGALAIINATEIALDHVAPDSIFGNPLSDFVNWAAQDPATLAENLRWTKLYMYVGNGLPGPYDATPNVEASVIEGAVNRDTVDFHNRLDALGIPSFYDQYGNGTHSWPYWARDLRLSIGAIMADFAHPAPPPAAFTYTSANPSYSSYGWRVTMHRSVREFSTLQGAGPKGFTLLGSGAATVLTPARYRSGARYAITIKSRTGTMTTPVKAARRGRLRIQVPLGPSDTQQEYSLGGPPLPSPGTTVYVTRVTITRWRG